MICVKSNGLLCLCSNFYREWLAHLIWSDIPAGLQSDPQNLKLLDLQFEDRVRDLAGRMLLPSDGYPFTSPTSISATAALSL